MAGSFGSRRAEGPSGSFFSASAAPRRFRLPSGRWLERTEQAGDRGRGAPRRGSSRPRCGTSPSTATAGGRVEDIASEVGVAKGTVFLDFGSKEGLFLEAYQRAVSLLPAWLDAPTEIVEAEGFWATLDWWLERTEEFIDDDSVPNRVAMIGRYDTGLGLRRPIDRFMRSEDPYGTLEFVEFGVRRGELRDDVDVEMIASMLDWLAERFQDALVSEELDPGLIHRRPERREMRIKEFLEVLRGRDRTPSRPDGAARMTAPASACGTLTR